MPCYVQAASLSQSFKWFCSLINIYYIKGELSHWAGIMLGGGTRCNLATQWPDRRVHSACEKNMVLQVLYCTYGRINSGGLGTEKMGICCAELSRGEQQETHCLLDSWQPLIPTLCCQWVQTWKWGHHISRWHFHSCRSCPKWSSEDGCRGIHRAFGMVNGKHAPTGWLPWISSVPHREAENDCNVKYHGCFKPPVDLSHMTTLPPTSPASLMYSNTHEPGLGLSPDPSSSAYEEKLSLSTILSNWQSYLPSWYFEAIDSIWPMNIHKKWISINLFLQTWVWPCLTLTLSPVCPLCPVQYLWDQGGAELSVSGSLPAPVVAPSLTPHWEHQNIRCFQGCKVLHSCLLSCKAVHTLETHMNLSIFYFNFFFFLCLLLPVAVLPWQAFATSGAPSTLSALQPSPEVHYIPLNTGQSGTWWTLLLVPH